ncbi:arsenate reductase [Legionella pneumophila]|nr:arsenate reductase [Legionella pneumophila]CZH33426.1 arsenate reductase [Legionella pneumophila]
MYFCKTGRIKAQEGVIVLTHFGKKLKKNMEKITIYHNPRCSKSRQALEILKNKGFDPIVIEYLKTPLDLEQLKILRNHLALEDLVRTNENVFKELGLSLDNEAQVLEAMVKEPILMQRPIVTFKGKSVIGRPPEKVLELFD